MTGLQGRCVWKFSDSTSGRVALRVGTSGVDLEVGASQRVSEFSSAGLAVAIGLYVSHRSPVFLAPNISVLCWKTLCSLDCSFSSRWCLMRTL